MTAPPGSGKTHRMTNRLAIWIGLLILAALAVDIWVFGSEHLVFLGRKLFVLLDWMAFWR